MLPGCAIISINIWHISLICIAQSFLLSLLSCIYCRTKQKQGKSEGYDSCDRPSNLKLDSNHQFLHPCALEICWMTLKNNRALLLYYIKLCASFQIHRWIHTGVTVWKPLIPVKIGDILSRVTFRFDRWLWNTIGHLFFTTSSFVHHFKSIGEVKLSLHSGNAQFGPKLVIFVPPELEIWWMTLKNNRAPLL